MKKIFNNSDLNEALYGASNLGFVPTMGSLHKGHISLIKNSLKNCKKTIVSIFVNPTQFNKKNDYLKYPRNLKSDLSILKKLKVDFVYMPKNDDVYSFKRKFPIKLNKKDKILCAKYRKGHFEGVIDVMDRLVKLVKPQKIFMGEKDFQQIYLIKRYIKRKYKVNIISCKTIRDNNKLALSSRNLLLKKKQLINLGKLTTNIFGLKKELKKIKNIKKFFFFKKKELNKNFDISIEYLELRNILNLKISNKIKNSKIFIAYYFKNVRLIDNI